MKTQAAPEPSAGQSMPPGFEELGIVRRRGVRGWFRRHPRCMDAVVVGVYLLLSLWVYPYAFYDLGDRAWWLLLGYGVIAGALLFRRSHPIPALALITLAEGCMLLLYPWQGGQMLGLCFAAYAVARNRGLLIGLLISLPACVLGYLPFLRNDQWNAEHGRSWWMENYYEPMGLSEIQSFSVLAVTLFFSVGISAGIGAAVRRGRSHEQEVLEWARRTQSYARVAERNRIAREMHDVIAHSLSVMISLADGARIVARKDPHRAGEVLEELSDTGRTALGDMRRVIGVLREGQDVEAARRPIGDSLEELYEGFRQAGLPLTVSLTGPQLPEDAGFGLTVHRIIQESLTNVLRYGRQVTDVTVTIEHRPGPDAEEARRLRSEGLSSADQAALGMPATGQVVLTITDDGLHPAHGERRESMGSGQGIHGMEERAGFYNGSVYAGPAPRRGWMVRADLEPPQKG
ncbi:sensor histidine kinase [Nesterenkonia halotolerans]|uniref:histidine kinase n=1 Tax=Nesterenkonia halotolerans TaxID=225325 RepID=A0ABR9J7L8_9MICC|nr:histidine kinase [Nesterenkonia halotolerans]MBE1514989.1 signal transduction histidine kinase [Nesterenkonia halotolerans]